MSRVVLVVSACLVLVVALALPAGAGAARRHPARGACAYAGTPATALTNAQVHTAVVCLINRQRTSRGLPALAEDGRLDRSAQGWTLWMVIHHQFTHGSDFAARISSAGLSWSWAGENIATGYATPQQVMSGWMASTGHCQNILSPSYSLVGIGIIRHPVSPFATGPSTWTQDFALPMGASPPSGNSGPANGCPY